MIWFMAAEVEDNTGRISFTIRIDAKSARISESEKMRKVQVALDKKIADFARDIKENRDYNEHEQRLKDYLCNDLFRYGLNLIAVNDFIYDLRINVIKFSNNIALAGFVLYYEYKNYEGEIINLKKVSVSESGLVYFTVLIDADTAKIRNRDEKIYVESILGSKLTSLAHVMKEGENYKEKEEALRYYLKKELFYHLVDLQVIETFIDNFENKVVKFMEDIEKIGFEILFEYRNHSWEEEDKEERKRWWK